MSINRNGTVIAIFEDQEHAHQALNELRQAGFSDQQVGFVYREGTSAVNKTDVVVEDTSETSDGAKAETVDTAHDPALDATIDTIPTVTLPNAEQNTDIAQQTDAREEEHRIESPTEEDTQPGIVSFTGETQEAQDSGEATDTGEKSTEKQANFTDEKKITLDEATGVLTGSIVGGVLGAVAALLIPALGIAFAGGFLVTAFSTALGAVTGGFLGTLVALGIPEEDARQYEKEFKAGRTIVTVKTDDQQQEALNILCRNKAWYTNTHESE
jgi:outer membrane lipoprotein SlyB